MSFERNSNHQYGLDRRFPELVAADGEVIQSDRVRDRQQADWSPFRDPLAYDRSIPERPAFEKAIEDGATARQSTAPQPSPQVGQSAIIGTGLYRLWANWQHKREVARSLEHLRELDDHLLRDIGLERWQIQGR